MTEASLVAHVSTQAIENNIQAIRRRLSPGTPLCVAVKADAYGHGLRQVLPVLARAGVEQAAVAHLDEALAVRELGWERPLLCFGAILSAPDERTPTARADAALHADIQCTVTSAREAGILADAAIRAQRAARVQIKVDTGMGRMGVLADEAEAVIAEIARTPHISIEGIYTHFASADEPDLSFAREQLRRFTALADRLRMGGSARRGVKDPGLPSGALKNGDAARFGDVHAANSAAIFRLPEAHLDRVRPGLAVYGYWSGPADERPADLRPALRLTSVLAAVRRLPAGHAIGYGRTFTTQRDSIIGIVPIGYGDGYNRRLSNRAVLTLPATPDRPRQTVPLVGRVSMDQVSVDLTDVPGVQARDGTTPPDSPSTVQVGDEIIIIDDDPATPNSVESLARLLDTIPYEITCTLGQRIRRTAV